MTERYFEKFPTTVFEGLTAIDITRRVVPALTPEANPYAYIPYTVLEGERPDNVAYKVYGDSDLSWAIFLANGITDPYYDWPLDQRTWLNYIRDKYGSVQEATNKLLWWENNWGAHAEDRLSNAGFQALEDSTRRYWEADFGEGAQILSYKRRREDWRATTNLQVMQEIVYTSNVASFRSGEQALFYDANNQPQGNGQITYANTTTLQIQHVFGNTTGTDWKVVGQTSGAQANTLGLISENFVIPQDEANYYAPLYAYDWEESENARKRQILLFDPRYILDIAYDVRQKLKA